MAPVGETADWESREIRELKVGRYVNIEDEPCKIVSIDTSKPGKHGSAKANIVATSIFTGAKKSLVGPVSTKCQVPVIDKRKGQVLYTQDTEISILDIKTNETVTMEINEDHECSIEPGAEILYIVAMGRMKLL